MVEEIDISLLIVQKLLIWNYAKDFSNGNKKKTELYGYVDDFSVDYYAIAVDDIFDIYKYFMKSK